MELPATSGAGAPDAPLLQSDHQDAADFQQLYDASQATADPTEPTEPADPNNAVVEGEEGATEEVAEPEAKPPEKVAEKAAKKEPESESQSLEEFFAEHGQEPFLNLKFKTKVDGREEEATLSDLIRDRQLAAASYARMNEAAQARQQAQAERDQARQALGTQIAQAKELTQLAKNQLLQDFQRVPWDQMRNSADPQERANYSILYTDFQARNSAIEQTLQQIAAAEKANAQAADTQRQQAVATERERLFQARPDWRDPVKAQAAHQAITAMGRTLGFTDAELTAISDHRMLLGLHKLAELTAQSQKQQAALPKVLKRVRAAPKMAAPGTRQAASPRGGANPKLEEAWMSTGGRNDQLGAAVFERFVS